jgi:hypothetical protein
MLSTIAEVSLGDGLLMSSRANRTAAMIDAAITSVDANLSCFRRSASSLAMARRISPISAPSFPTSPACESVGTRAYL